jgi:glycosyltransferase involved in cell wall biosynthesis
VRFSIVIPTFNNLPELKACLAALERLHDRDFEVFVGVDGSTDGTWQWLQATRFNFPCLALQHPGGTNEGRAATRNLALPHLQGTYTLFLDSDMEPGPDMLAAHFAVVAGGNHVSIGTVHYRNAQYNLWVRYTSERGVAKFQHGQAAPFHYFITPNTMVPTEWLLAVQGFDAQISRYGGEDMELGYRIHKRFAPAYIYNALAIAQTTQPKTLEQALPQLQEYGATGLRYITHKWPELSGIYWVHKCTSGRIQDRLFEAFIGKGWQNLAMALLRVSPYFIQKHLISYLVVARVHMGYRTGSYAQG